MNGNVFLYKIDLKNISLRRCFLLLQLSSI